MDDYLKKLDAWLRRGEGGAIPINLLQHRGVEFPQPPTLSDAALTARLWQVLEAMASIGMYVTFTDHLSDRELYDHLVSDILLEEGFLDPGDPCMGRICDMIGDGTEESNRIYLTHYADEDIRRDWRERFGDPLPPSLPAPFDRDRFLPTMEKRAWDYRHGTPALRLV